MKNIVIILSFFLILSGCGKLEDLNKNVKDPSAVSGESLFTYAQKKLVDQVVSTNVNFNISRLIVQYWTETTYPQESQYDIFERKIPDGQWDVMYRDVLKNFQESSKAINSSPLGTELPEVRKNKLAIIKILTAYTYSNLVETFGNIPYSQALQSTILTPKYDDGLTIYKSLIDSISDAISTMTATAASFGIADNIYGGKSNLWIKFANSLKLRMGITLADVDNTFAKTTIESAAAGVFTNNSDDAKMKYLGAQPNANPLYVDLVSSGRDDFVAADTIIDIMNSFSDPRLNLYFQKTDTSKDGSGKMAYLGGKPGEGNAFDTYSHFVDLIEAPSYPGTILDYTEVEFILAEAAARGYSVTGTAEDHYNKAIEASILDWNGKNADVVSYLANPKVAYSTATGDYKQKIGIQKYIALYNRTYEAWTEVRRLDTPKLVAPKKAISVFPVRLTYPVEEQTLNGSNYKIASDAIGGDNVDTKLFWDKY